MIGIKGFCCKNCGLDCSFVATGMNERQVAQKIIQHMHEDHDMTVIPADVMYKIKHSINTINIVATGSPVTEKEKIFAR